MQKVNSMKENTQFVSPKAGSYADQSATGKTDKEQNSASERGISTRQESLNTAGLLKIVLTITVLCGSIYTILNSGNALIGEMCKGLIIVALLILIEDISNNQPQNQI